jgi:penicillin amidase
MPLSLRVGFMKHDFSIDFYFRANLAHEPNDFLPYRSQCLMSNFNVHYATKSGDIGYFTMGIINLKKYQDRFCHGFSSKDDIINEVPQDELLFITNPKKGYIVSANNKPVTENYLYKLVGNHNNARAHRINELLSEYIKNNTKISVKEATEIVKDVKDSNAQYIIPKYLTILRKKLNAKELREDALFLMLAKWDYKYTPESRGATLWSVLERNLCTFILTRNLTNLDKYKLVLNYYPYYKFIHGLIDKISRGEKVMLRKCAVFNDNEDCEKYLVDVFVHLGMDIQKYLDSSGDVKKWGEVNYNYFPHTPFEDIPILKYFYSRKKYVGGNKDTVKISRSPGNSKYGDFVGMQTPKGQFVYDMADPEQPYLIIVGGNGGSPMQQYYNNLMDEFEQKKLIKFKNIDFNDPKYQERIITLEKRRN